MTPLEDGLRAAMRATAEQIPPGSPSPLILRARRRPIWCRPPGWRAWVIPLAAVVLAGVVVAGSLALASVLTRRPAPASLPFRPQPNSVMGAPAYYVALTSPSGDAPGLVPKTTTLTIRATATGKVLATVAVPKPYRAFTAVAAAADDRTFVLLAEAGQAADPSSAGAPGFPLARLYLLHLDPASPTAAGQVRLQALPAADVPAGNAVLTMALSADGTSLAATIGNLVHSKLYVYHLRTGDRHVWNWFDCDNCAVSGVVGPYPRVLSWAADGRTLLFVYLDGGLSKGQVRLLNTDATGTNLFTDSKAVGISLGGPDRNWLDAAVTPDGRTIVAVREITGASGQPATQQLVMFSASTGKPAATYGPTPLGPDYEQIQWTSTSGRVLILTGAQRARGAEVLKDGRATQLPWSSQIYDAAW